MIPEADMVGIGLRAGEPPSSVFMGIDIDARRCVLVLAGLIDIVERFVRRVSRSTRDRGVHLVLWRRFDEIHNLRGDSERFEFGACCLGAWPQDRMQGLVETVHVPGSGPRMWAKQYLEHLARDPERERVDGTEDLGQTWVALYIEQAETAAYRR